MAIKNTNCTEDNTACKTSTPAESPLELDAHTALATELAKKFISRRDRIGQGVEKNTKTDKISVTIEGKDELLKRLQKHLAGELRLGLYGLLPDGTVQWAMVEFEHHGVATGEDSWLADAVKLQQWLTGNGIPSILERSKNPNGQCYHLHIVLDQPLPAKDVRDGLRGIGREIFGTFTNEIFPKSDEGLGHFVWMPLFGGKDEWGLGVKDSRTVFVGAEGCPFEDQYAILANWQSADAGHFSEVIQPYLAALPASIPSSKPGDGIEENQPGLEKMEANCPIVKHWIENPVGWTYDHWLGLGSNYIVFKGGWERFVELSKKDTANFSQYEINRIREEVLAFHGPQTYEKFREQGLDLELPGQAPKAPAGWKSWIDPSHDTIREENGVYVKLNKFGGKDALSTFMLDPKELLRLPYGDVLTCSVHSTLGYTYENVRIENSDWYSRSKLMTTIGHSDCTFHGSDVDAIDVCWHVVSRVPVRKQGTRVIGLHDDLWVLRDCNINAAGYVDPMRLVPYDRSQESLHSKIKYQHLDDDEYRVLARGFFGNVLGVNLPRVMLPMLGWFFAAPMKVSIQKIDGSFPLLLCYGSKGAGKTTVLEKLLAFQGYTDPTPHSCTTKSFPLLRLLASTNAVPVFLDEYKTDIGQDATNIIKRYMRKAYRGEVEEKGNPDQTVTPYYIEAPLIVCGELKITEAAILDRVIIAGFTNVIEDRQDMQQAFAALNILDAAGFMDRYVMFCLGEDIPARLQQAKDQTRTLLTSMLVGPRVFINLSVMVFGLQMMMDFAKQWGVDLRKKIDLSLGIMSQIEEITGSGNGRIKDAAGILLEQMSMMIEKAILPRGITWTFARPKQASKELLCIHLPSAAAEVTAYKQRMNADFEVVDEAAYRKLFENADYMVQTQTIVKFISCGEDGKIERPKRAVVIDFDKAKASGLEIVGFRRDDEPGPEIEGDFTLKP
jgi:hypothetical protein